MDQKKKKKLLRCRKWKSIQKPGFQKNFIIPRKNQQRLLNIKEKNSCVCLRPHSRSRTFYGDRNWFEVICEALRAKIGQIYNKFYVNYVIFFLSALYITLNRLIAIECFNTVAMRSSAWCKWIYIPNLNMHIYLYLYSILKYRVLIYKK